jgi:hypothetical protein
MRNFKHTFRALRKQLARTGRGSNINLSTRSNYQAAVNVGGQDEVQSASSAQYAPIHQTAGPQGGTDGSREAKS